MNTPLTLAVDIARLVDKARQGGEGLPIQACASELFLRYPDCGYSRRDLIETLQEEAVLAQVPGL